MAAAVAASSKKVAGDDPGEVDEEALYTEALREQARLLGIDPDSEPHLLRVAEMALLSPPPKGWSEAHTPDGRAYFVRDDGSGETTWNNPELEKFKADVVEARNKHADNFKHVGGESQHGESQHRNATPRVEEQDSKSNSAQISEVGSPSTSSSVSDASSAEKGRDTTRLRTRTEHERNEDKEFAPAQTTDNSADKIERILSRRIVYPNDGGEPGEYKVHWFGTRASEDEWFLRSSLVIDYVRSWRFIKRGGQRRCRVNSRHIVSDVIGRRS